MRIITAAFRLLADAGIAWMQDKASLYAAAIAYYMVFSIAPLLVMAISIAGRFFGRVAVEGQIVTQVEGFIGPEAAILLENLLTSALEGSSSFTLISGAILLWAASGVFNHLKRALDIIYGVIPTPSAGLRGALHVIRTRALTFLMVLFMAILLLISLALNTVAATLGNWLSHFFPELATINTYVTTFITPFILFTLFSILFKMLSEARVAWRDVWLGALVTTLLFLLGVYVIGFYLSIGNVGSVYGAAGSLIVALVWIYYSAQIVMYGAEFTKIYANKYGTPIVPRSTATSLAEHYSNVQVIVNPGEELQPEQKVYFQPQAPQPRSHSSPPTQRRKQLAAGLLGLATGLFLAFIGKILNEQ